MPATTVSISADIPSTTALFSGASKLNAISIQSDCDCMIQFQKTDNTALSGKIHLPKYSIYSLSEYGDGLLSSSGGIKLVVTGCPTGRIEGFAIQHG